MSEENVEIARRFIDAVARDDMPAALACLDPDLEWIPYRAATEGAYVGHDGFQRYAADTYEHFDVSEVRIELRDLGSQVLAWGTIRLSAKGSGIEMKLPVGGLYRFRGGRISRWYDFGSKQRALEAAGQTE